MTAAEAEEYFSKFWSVYPERAGTRGKAEARKRFLKIVASGEPAEKLIWGARHYAEEQKRWVGTEFIATARTWLNQKRWEDYEDMPAKPKYTLEEIEAGREWYRKKMARHD